MMLIPSIRVGQYDVLTAGSFLALPGETSRIAIPLPVGALNFDFRMVTTDPPGETQINFENPEPNTLVITLTNWASPLGTTLTAPQHVGSFSGRTLYLLFSHHSLGAGASTGLFNYTFYLGAPVGSTPAS